MLKHGDRVNPFYYEGEEQTESSNCVVEEYDNGLLKATWEPGPFLEEVMTRSGHEKPKKKTIIFNLRSIGFLKAEFVEQG